MEGCCRARDQEARPFGSSDQADVRLAQRPEAAPQFDQDELNGVKEPGWGSQAVAPVELLVFAATKRPIPHPHPRRVRPPTRAAITQHLSWVFLNRLNRASIIHQPWPNLMTKLVESLCWRLLRPACGDWGLPMRVGWSRFREGQIHLLCSIWPIDRFIATPDHCMRSRCNITCVRKPKRN